MYQDTSPAHLQRQSPRTSRHQESVPVDHSTGTSTETPEGLRRLEAQAPLNSRRLSSPVQLQSVPNADPCHRRAHRGSCSQLPARAPDDHSSVTERRIRGTRWYVWTIRDVSKWVSQAKRFDSSTALSGVFSLRVEDPPAPAYCARLKVCFQLYNGRVMVYPEFFLVPGSEDDVLSWPLRANYLLHIAPFTMQQSKETYLLTTVDGDKGEWQRPARGYYPGGKRATGLDVDDLRRQRRIREDDSLDIALNLNVGSNAMLNTLV